MLTTRLHTVLLAASALTVCAGLAPAGAPSGAQELQDRDHKDLAKHFAEYLDPKTDPDQRLEVRDELSEALAKLGKKFVEKGEDPLQGALALTADLGQALQLSTELKSKRGGTTLDGAVEFRGEPITYKVWVPSKYKHNGAPLPLMLCLPGLGEGGRAMGPDQFLSEHWTPSAAREEALIAAIAMPDDVGTWGLVEADGKPGGVAVLMSTLRDLRETYAIDPDRVYLVGREAGVEAAVTIGGMFPHLFAGVVGRAGDAGETGWSNFRNLPTFFQGGGAKATAFHGAVQDEFGNCTLQPEASDDDLWTWMQAHPRVSNPTRVTLVPGSPIPNKAYWVEIPPIAAEGEISLDAQVDRDTNTVTVTSTGVPTVTLYFNDVLLDLDKPIKLVLNGVEQETLVPRSVDELLNLIARGTSDPGKLYVARGAYDLP